MNNNDEFLLVEKYRPRKISDCILPKALEKTFQEIVSNGNIPNMILAGTAGTGKTTVAKALCNELNVDFIVINASEEGNIDTLRNKIRQFASTVSLNGGRKIVILDEADGLTGAVQNALRTFIEEFSKNCGFVLTCNFKNKIIEPLQSRCAVYDFTLPVKEKPVIAAKFYKRLQEILEQESIEYDEKAVMELVTKFFPDFRRILNEIQRYSLSGKIDANILVVASQEEMNQLMDYIKNKKFTEMRKWVTNTLSTDPAAIFRGIYEHASDSMTTRGLAQTILILGEYQYKHAFVADHQLNMIACLTEIMSQAEWK